MNATDADRRYMWRCLQLALCGEGHTSPNPMVGAVVVSGQSIIGEGYHVRYGSPHAEVNAIRSVRRRELIEGSTVYVSLEPCSHYGKTPPCADMLISHRVGRVVVGCRDPFPQVNGHGIAKLREAGIEVTEGVLEEECLRLNRAFFTLHRLRRPYVTLKWAQSRDGFIDVIRTAGTGQQPARLSTGITRTLAHRLRSASQAILVGGRTALLDNPSLTTRLWAGASPLRVVTDTHGTLPASLHLFDGTTPTRVYTLQGHTPLYSSLPQVTVVALTPEASLPEAVLGDLASQGITSLIVEGGASTLQAFIDSGLWDEARVETAATLLGAGVQAPCLAGATLAESFHCDANRIDTYTQRRTAPANLTKC